MREIECPVPDGIECPYFKNGICQLANPYEECDDYYAEVGDED